MKPIVVVSRCFGFARCRYDGLTVLDPAMAAWIKALRPYVEWQTVCPESDLKLGIPRPPIRVVNEGKGELRLFQPETGIDLTDRMNRFSEAFLDSHGEADGFILKGKSPSCGVGDTKIFPDTETERILCREHGFFARHVLARYGATAILSERLLLDQATREEWLIRLFLHARWRETKLSGNPARLADFHRANRFWLASLNPIAFDQLESQRQRLRQTDQKYPVADQFNVYEKQLVALLRSLPRRSRRAALLKKIVSRYNDSLRPRVRGEIREALNQYQFGSLPLGAVILGIQKRLGSQEEANRFRQDLSIPYPQTLIEKVLYPDLLEDGSL